LISGTGPCIRFWFIAPLGLIVLVRGFPANAESPTVTAVEQIAANPDAPVFAFVWRRAPRATLAATLPIFGSAPDATIGLRVTPFVEIYNRPGAVLILPNENWRGRLSVELWRLWTESNKGASAGTWLRTALAYEHESDHSSVRGNAPRFAFRSVNDLNLRVAASTSSVRRFVATAELDSRLFVFSCTQPNIECLDKLNAVGYGGSLDLTSQLRFGNDWHAFWSMSLSWIVPSGELVKELRLVSHWGVWKRHGGMWQFFVLAYLGSELGLDRTKSLQQVGLGIRWAP
jgi:hypothetical protein